MFRLGVIEESVQHTEQVLDKLNKYYFSQRIENVPDDAEPILHTNEYRVPDDKIDEIAHYLSSELNWHGIYMLFQMIDWLLF